MKFIATSKTRKLFIVLALTLSCLLVSAAARKSNRSNSKGVETEEQIQEKIEYIKANIYGCFGVGTLYQNKSNRHDFMSVCRYKKNHTYNQHSTNAKKGFAVTTEVGDSDKGPLPKFENLLKNSYTEVDLYGKMRNTCKSWCGSDKDALIRLVTFKRRPYACMCSKSETEQTYYFISYRENDQKTKEESKVTDELAIKGIVDLKNYDKHIPVPEGNAKRRYKKF